MGTPKDQTYVDDHDYQHNPKDQLARRFLILDLGSNGLQRTNTHCGSDNVVGENDPWSDIVDGFHGFAKLLTIADRGHAGGMACCKDSKFFRRLISVPFEQRRAMEIQRFSAYWREEEERDRR